MKVEIRFDVTPTGSVNDLDIKAEPTAQDATKWVRGVNFHGWVWLLSGLEFHPIDIRYEQFMPGSLRSEECGKGKWVRVKVVRVPCSVPRAGTESMLLEALGEIEYVANDGGRIETLAHKAIAKAEAARKGD